MVTSLEIVDNNKCPIYYAYELEQFKNGAKFEFKPGVNIIIGNNGCGKSTLMKLLSSYLLCDRGESKISEFNFELNKLFSLREKLYDGIKVKSDYFYKSYNFISHKDVSFDDAMRSFDSFGNYFENIHSSTGEQNINTLLYLFDTAFKNKDYKFPIEQIKNSSKLCNKFNDLLKYYEDNGMDYKEYQEITFLLDEPDRNLDIDYIEQLYNILSFHKKHTQLICVIHNPILIYKLSKLDNINFIEMSDGYLDKVKQLFKNL